MFAKSQLCFALAVLSAPAAAQSVLICHFSQNGGRHVAAFDPQDGSLQTASFIDIDRSGVANRPIQAALTNGEWWVSDNVTETAHVFSEFGARYSREGLGFHGDTEGCVTAFGSSWFCAQEAPFVVGSLIEVNALGQETTHTLSIDAPEGIGAFNGELVITHGRGIKRFDPVTRTEVGDFYTSLGQQGMLQPTVRPSTGTLLVARQAGHQDVAEFDAAGNLVAEYDVGSTLGLNGPFACLELGNGDFLLATDAGVFVVDTALTTSRVVLEGVRARYMTSATDVRIGATYCGPAVVNSTGRSAFIAATGSSVAAHGELRVAAHDLPTMASGYFIASQTQGLVMHPGGSAGNLCLGGSIGRLAMQVRFTSTVHYFEIEVDMTRVPQPNGVLPILAGATWNWQAWFRDSLGGQATSNFTDAVSVSFQ